jgi:hypothetical protein
MRYVSRRTGLIALLVICLVAVGVGAFDAYLYRFGPGTFWCRRTTRSPAEVWGDLPVGSEVQTDSDVACVPCDEELSRFPRLLRADARIDVHTVQPCST